MLSADDFPTRLVVCRKIDLRWTIGQLKLSMFQNIDSSRLTEPFWAVNLLTDGALAMDAAAAAAATRILQTRSKICQ